MYTVEYCTKNVTSVECS